MKLKCIGRYVNEPKNIAYNVGDVFDPSPTLYQFLMADAPACFEEYKEPVKKVTKPARGKTK